MEKNTFGFSRKIGTTLYRANIYCSPQSAESFEEKLMRLIRHDALDIYNKYGIMSVPQMSRQSERSHYGYYQTG